MDNVATMRRTYDLINAGDIDGFVELLADDFVEHEEMPPGISQDTAGTKEFFRMTLAGMPDLRMDVQDVVADGNKVVARVKCTGTHAGEFMGIPATGNRVDVALIDIMAFGDDGLVHEHWGVMDNLSMMQQLGVLPAGPPA